MDQNINSKEPLPTMDYPTEVPSFEQKLPDYAVQARLSSLTDSAFGKGLAATIMAEIPIASIISIFMGNASLKLAKQATEYAAEHGTTTGGKNTAAKILGNIGKWLGLASTIAYGLFFVIYALYIIFFLFIFIASEM